MNNKEILVSIIGENTKTEYVIDCINSLLNQQISTNRIINIYIGINLNANIEMERILETINYIDASRFSILSFDIENKYKDKTWYIKKSKKISMENNIDWILPLFNTNAFYKSTSLDNFLNLINICKNKQIILANSVNYDISNKYIGNIDCNSFNNESLYDAIFNRNLLTGAFKTFNDFKILDIEYTNLFLAKHIAYNYPLFNISKVDSKITLNYEHRFLVNQFLFALLKKEGYSDTLKKINDAVGELEFFAQNNFENYSELLKYHNTLIKLANMKLKFLTYLAYLRYRQKTGKINVVFFCGTFNTWSSLESVYLAMRDDPRFETKLVYSEKHHFNTDKNVTDSQQIEAYKNAGYHITLDKDYNLQEQTVDIAFFVIPYAFKNDIYTIDNVKNYVKRCIYVPYGFTLETEEGELVRLRYKIAMPNIAWKVICDDDFDVKLAKKYSWTKNNNFVAWGNPRIDALYNLPYKQDENYIKILREKSNNRTIVLWNTHHSISKDCSSFSSWAIFGLQLIDYIKNNANFYFVWRPHPYFFGALEKYLGKTEYLNFRNNVSEIDNLIIDNYPNYLASFYISNIFISDLSSLVKEYVFLNKPILVTLKNKGLLLNKELEECLYISSNMKELSMYIDDIINDKDILKSKRTNYINKYSFCFKKVTVGKQITNRIYDNLQEELFENNI